MSFSTKNNFSTRNAQGWWLDILVPLLLSATLFVGVFFLIYSGQKHRRISSQIEQQFIEFSLRAAGPKTTSTAENIEIISLSKSDESTFQIKETNKFRDTSIKDYAKLLSHVLEKNPKIVYLSWYPPAHAQEESYDPLIAVLKSANKKNKIRFVLREEYTGTLPSELMDYATFLSNDACLGRTQVVCSYGGKKWDHWIPQNIANFFGPSPEAMDESNVTTTSLPPLFPSYLLNLKPEKSFNQSSFQETLESKQDQISGKSVFIGNSLIQTQKSPKDYYLDIGRVRTPRTEGSGDIRKNGAPLHVYWAQLAEMFQQRDLIAAPPQELSWAISGLFVVFILLILMKYGMAISIGVFLISASTAPLLNAISTHYYHVYIPVFDSIFGGLSAFLFASFGKLSLSAYRSWWMSIQEQQEEESRDLKGNFISLISHNLNTPVAKMQGMLDILEQYSTEEPTIDIANKANALVAEIQLCIRTVLASNALDEENLAAEPLTIDRLQKELKLQFKNSLQRMNILTDVETDKITSGEQEVPFVGDKRIIATAISAVAASDPNLPASSAKQLSIRIFTTQTLADFDSKNLDTPLTLRCQISGPHLEYLSSIKHKASFQTLREEVSATLLNSLDNSSFGQTCYIASSSEQQPLLEIDFSPTPVVVSDISKLPTAMK